MNEQPTQDTPATDLGVETLLREYRDTMREEELRLWAQKARASLKCLDEARVLSQEISTRLQALTDAQYKEFAAVQCPTVIDHDRDGNYERCTLCGKSWPEGARSACQSAAAHLQNVVEQIKKCH